MTTEQLYADGGSELGRFLRARRAQVAPEDVGLPTGTGLRRTPGLRREELATLAGVSIDYYARLERGKEMRPSPSVVDALARALQLEEDEREHLHGLVVRVGRTAPGPPAAPSRTVPPGALRLLESMRPNPAAVVSRTHDVLAWNPAGPRLLVGIEDWPAKQRNYARYLFLHPAARDLFDDWDNQIRGCIAHLRALAGTHPDAPDLTRLVGELLLKSREFARLWERYEVKGHSRGLKTFHHPEVGDLTLGHQSMRLEGTPGHRVLMFFAEPGTPDHDAIVLLDLLGQEPASEGAAPGSGPSAAAPDGDESPSS
ncbi:helix-turn-helix transcriptional regulator [Streptomyces mirabilis]|uniref:Helix-turn-helix transcriptional regulator n=1 Tax=Streptomyces mirabilis TaxID=68239 RepID=A0ABU3UER9_9ACTN|nr:helix-turn-helix transcriptional regulator [Streptomyces mirabilis]MDU8992363.1 helix-turn-helix transcriptional regulator [Streptomyces mirabilis]